MPRLSCVALAAMLSGVLALPIVAAAQSSPPSATQTRDPPTRAGRIALVTGGVSFRDPGADQWTPALLNFPITDGDVLRTEPTATAAIEVSASRITLDGETELDVNKLDGESLVATLQQGQVALRLRHLAPGESVTLFTRHGSVRFTEPGRYGVLDDESDHATLVTVLEGQAHLLGAGLDQPIAAGQAARITGAQPLRVSIEAAWAGPFLNAMLPPEGPPPVLVPPVLVPPVAEAGPPEAPPPMVEVLPGAADLGAYGSWQASAEYGTVWYPAVGPDWVPYSDGRWVFVAPWGWTWVDNEPWGFAPFHYGRWVHHEHRWAWVPYGDGPHRWDRDRPVYAPALVGFVGAGGPAGYRPPTGWFPLGAGEPYQPWYRSSPSYLREVNRGHVRDLDNVAVVINNDRHLDNYANRGAAIGGAVRPATATVGAPPPPPRQWSQPPAPRGQVAPPPAFQQHRDSAPPVPRDVPQQGQPQHFAPQPSFQQHRDSAPPAARDVPQQGQPQHFAPQPSFQQHRDSAPPPMPRVIEPPPQTSFQQHRDSPPPAQQQIQPAQQQQQRFAPPQQRQPQRSCSNFRNC